MEEIGKILREVREEKNISLEEISQATKIQMKYLVALEEGDFSIFSGEIYIKGALKNYAQAAGINVDEVLILYNRLKKSQGFNEKNEQQAIKKGRKVFSNRQERKPLPGVAFIWICVLFIVFAGSIWYLYGHSRPQNKKAPPSTGYFTEGTENKEEPAAPVVIPPEKPPAKKELVKIAEDNSEVTYALNGVERAEIVLNFPGCCWVRVFQEGVQVEEKTFQPGESKSLGDARETLIHFGNPPAAKMTVNGLTVDNLAGFTRPVKIIIIKSDYS